MYDDSNDVEVRNVAAFTDLELESTEDSPTSLRRRFNSGFHDGTLEASWGENPRDVSKHHDPLYANAYLRGHADFQHAGARAVTSDDAWDDFKADVVAWRESQPRTVPIPRIR